MNYADTSFLVPLYIIQSASPLAAAEMRALKGPLLFTAFHRHELRNAIRLCVFRKSITTTVRSDALARLDEDVGNGVYASCAIPWNEAFARAEELGVRHTERLGNRGFDVLHVAAALALGATTFFTFDLRQKALAKAAGFKVRP